MEYKNINKCYSNDFMELYHCDCMELLKQTPDNYYSLALVDPPYGLGNRLSDGGGKLKNTPMATLYREKDWDILPTAEYWQELFRVSKNQVVFGANYFLEFLPNTRGFVCWDKKQDMPTLSACELVWTSFDKPAKIMKKSSMDLDRFHPTQKPIYVYEWMFKYCKTQENDLILDTHFGSGSIALAVDKANRLDKMNLHLTACEIDKEYIDKAIKRISESIKQGTLSF
jgi:site-specific DNA-methyltransferase (adenine-specific)